MFKIQDNEDGSTSIFCKNSGSLLCTIPGSRGSIIPRRINVVGPHLQPGTSQGSSCHHLKPQKSISMKDELSDINDESEEKPTHREIKRSISPIPVVTLHPDFTGDYFDDCISQEEFARCLNLIAKEKQSSESRDHLLEEFPLRLLSRSKTYRSLEDDPTEDLRLLKFPDYMPLTSYLGMKILKLNESRNFSNEQKNLMAVKKYDSFCRCPFKTPNPSSCHFPKLRCREIKQYPIMTTVKVLKHDANHHYTYGRRQRHERMLILKTGLERKSRILLRMCNVKVCVVALKKLTKEAIKTWTARKPGSIRPFFSNSDRHSTKPVLIVSPMTMPQKKAHSTLSRTHVSKPNKNKLATILKWALERGPDSKKLSAKQKWQLRCNSKCVVSLTNVIKSIYKRSDGYYFRGTNLKVPSYKKFLYSVESKKRNEKRTQIKSEPSSSSDCEYFPYFSKKLPSSNLDRGSCSYRDNSGPKAPLKPRNNKLDSCPQNKSSTLFRSSSIRSPDNTRTIPIIDLTGETSPSKATANQNCAPNIMRSNFIEKLLASSNFQCFACGCKRHFGNSHQGQGSIGETYIQDHMRKYHSVTEPEQFLTRYFDRINNSIIIEAFPGYKSSFTN